MATCCGPDLLSHVVPCQLLKQKTRDTDGNSSAASHQPSPWAGWKDYPQGPWLYDTVMTEVCWGEHSQGQMGEGAHLEEVSRGVTSFHSHRGIGSPRKNFCPCWVPCSFLTWTHSQCLNTSHPCKRPCTEPKKLKTEMSTTESRQVRITGFALSPIPYFQLQALFPLPYLHDESLRLKTGQSHGERMG